MYAAAPEPYYQPQLVQARPAPAMRAYSGQTEPLAMAPTAVYASAPDPYYGQQVVCEAALGRRAATGPYIQEMLELPQVSYLQPSMQYGGPMVQEIVEMPAPVTYMAAPQQTIVEVVRDDAEINALRLELEDRAQLINDFGRRNEDLKHRNAELERLLDESEANFAAADGERSALRNNVQSDERALANQEHETKQLQDARDKLLVKVQDLQAKNDIVEAELQEIREQDEELRLVNGEQAQRIVELDDRVAILERELGERQLEIESLLRANEETEERLQAANARIAELEALVDELQQPPVEEYQQPPPPSPPPAAAHHGHGGHMSDEDIIDRHIQEFFMAHTDFQMAVNKEKPGLYKFDHPINKKVNMKLQGEKVLARVGGGWQIMEEWLLSERQSFLEAEDMEEQMEEEIPPPAPAPRAARPAPRAAATAPKAAAKRGVAAKKPAAKRPAAGGPRTQAHNRDQF